MVKTEATSKRKAEDEEAKETLVKVAGLTTIPKLSLTAAAGWKSPGAGRPHFSSKASRRPGIGST